MATREIDLTDISQKNENHPQASSDGGNVQNVSQHVEDDNSQDPTSQREEVMVSGTKVADDSDTRGMGHGRHLEDIRPVAVMSVGRDSMLYNMNHKTRGRTIILVNDLFKDKDLQPRKCARHDTDITRRAFTHLGFQVDVHWNLKTDDFLKTLDEVSSYDFGDSDCLVVVFMSHGSAGRNKEYLCTWDGKVETAMLWKYFTADKCPSLAGKPKLFFIQACRGENIDKGVHLQMERPPKGLPVKTDSAPETEYYVIPQHADMLVMWASYPGMFAFKSQNNGINGSVFIHFLAQILLERGHKETLSSLLLRVTREVATQYESYSPDCEHLHQTKQMPYMVSTLMRHVHFPVKV